MKINNKKNNNRIDWKALASDMSYVDEEMGIEEINSIPVRKPGKEKFFRVHPDKEYSIALQVLEIKDDSALKGEYVVPPPKDENLDQFFRENRAMIKKKEIVLCEDIAGKHFVWPVAPLSSEYPWHKTARKALSEARTKWTRIQPDSTCYKVTTIDKPNKPNWPKEEFDQILNTSFEGKIIDSIEHPVVQYLKGEDN